MHWREATIREHLDGTFTRVLFDGRIVTDTVDPNFIPPNAGGPKAQRGKDVIPQRANWTPTEDDVLWQMRLRNKPWTEVCWVLARTEDSAKKRYRILRAKGGRS